MVEFLPQIQISFFSRIFPPSNFCAFRPPLLPYFLTHIYLQYISKEQNINNTFLLFQLILQRAPTTILHRPTTTKKCTHQLLCMLCRCFSEICLFSYIKSNYSLRHSLLLSTYIEPSYHPQTKHINNSAVLRTRGQTLEILNIKTPFYGLCSV